MKRSNWRLRFAATMLLALVALAAAQRTSATDTPTAEVRIDNFSLSPATITVKAGTQVTWTNKDDIPHTVVSEDKSFKSKVLDTDEKFTSPPASQVRTRTIVRSTPR
jgi:plastocyanin